MRQGEKWLFSPSSNKHRLYFYSCQQNTLLALITFTLTGTTPINWVIAFMSYALLLKGRRRADCRRARGVHRQSQMRSVRIWLLTGYTRQQTVTLYLYIRTAALTTQQCADDATPSLSTQRELESYLAITEQRPRSEKWLTPVCRA